MTFEENKSPPAPLDSITFLGTGGARFVIISQVLATGGLWFNLGGTEFIVDPGPGAIVQATKRKLNPERLQAIIVSHRHLDHAADVNIMAEGMTRGGFKRHGRLYAPFDALDTEPVILNYLRRRLDAVETLVAGKTFTFDGVSFSTPVRHVHGVENYGLVFRTDKYTIGYITDTRYFPELLQHYAGVDLLMLNVVFLEPKTRADAAMLELSLPPSQTPREQDMPIDHLSVPDAELLIREIKPKIAILTHFGMGMWRAKPWTVAEKLAEQTGIRVIAARDGMKFLLSELDAK